MLPVARSPRTSHESRSRCASDTGVTRIRASPVPSTIARLWVWVAWSSPEPNDQLPLSVQPPATGTAVPGRVPWPEIQGSGSPGAKSASMHSGPQ